MIPYDLENESTINPILFYLNNFQWNSVREIKKKEEVIHLELHSCKKNYVCCDSFVKMCLFVTRFVVFCARLWIFFFFLHSNFSFTACAIHKYNNICRISFCSHNNRIWIRWEWKKSWKKLQRFSILFGTCSIPIYVGPDISETMNMRTLYILYVCGCIPRIWIPVLYICLSSMPNWWRITTICVFVLLFFFIISFHCMSLRCGSFRCYLAERKKKKK